MESHVLRDRRNSSTDWRTRMHVCADSAIRSRTAVLAQYTAAEYENHTTTTA